jgi:hypothetical protein
VKDFLKHVMATREAEQAETRDREADLPPIEASEGLSGKLHRNRKKAMLTVNFEPSQIQRLAELKTRTRVAAGVHVREAVERYLNDEAHQLRGVATPSAAPEAPGLRMYRNGAGATYVASSVEDAHEANLARHGFEPGAADPDGEGLEGWELLPLQSVLAVAGEDGKTIRKTVAEWLSDAPPGYFGSRDF